jgi:hypothetical protein
MPHLDTNIPINLSKIRILKGFCESMDRATRLLDDLKSIPPDAGGIGPSRSDAVSAIARVNMMTMHWFLTHNPLARDGLPEVMRSQASFNLRRCRGEFESMFTEGTGECHPLILPFVQRTLSVLDEATRLDGYLYEGKPNDAYERHRMGFNQFLEDDSDVGSLRDGGWTVAVDPRVSVFTGIRATFTSGSQAYTLGRDHSTCYVIRHTVAANDGGPSAPRRVHGLDVVIGDDFADEKDAVWAILGDCGFEQERRPSM